MNNRLKKGIATATLVTVVGQQVTPIVVQAQEITSIERNVDNIKSIGILGTPLYEGTKVTFPNASYDKIVTGYEIKTGVPTKYTVGGVEKTSTDGVISSKDIVESIDFTNILKSLQLDISEKDANIEVKVGEEKEGYVYLPSNGHYYKGVDKANLKYQEAIDLPKTHSLFGAEGYMPTITNEEENEVVKRLANNTNIYVSGTDSEQEGVWKFNTGTEEGQIMDYFGWTGIAPTPNNGGPRNNEDEIVLSESYNMGWNDTNKDYCDSIDNIVNRYIVEIDSKGSILGEIVASGSLSKVEEQVTISFEGIKDIQTEKGKEVNLLEGVSAKSNDNTNLDLTYEVLNSNGEVIKNFDFNTVGEYTVKYKASYKDVESTESCKLIVGEEVVVDEVNSIDISKGLENAVVESNRGYILGFKVEATSDSDVTFKYTLSNGETVENTTKVLNFYDKYTTEEVENILKSMTIESESNVELTVTLGNLKDTMVYTEEEGHYYELVTSKETFANAITKSKEKVFNGVNGYIATIQEDSVNTQLGELIVKNGENYSLIGNDYVKGERVWVNGEPMSYTNYTSDAQLKADRPVGISSVYDFKWANVSRTTSQNYMVEYGQPNERLPKPTINSTSTTTVDGRIEQQEVNSIDITNGLENTVITSSRDYILGFKVEGVSESPITYTYTLNGEEITNTNSILNFYDKYTTKEVEDILKSMVVESDSNVELKVTIGNIHPNMGYVESEGHYYELKYTDNNSKIGWNKANELAKAYTFLGKMGYLACITSEEQNAILDNFLNKGNTSGLWLGANDTRKESSWEWVSGEEFTYTNWSDSYFVNNTKQNYMYAGYWEGVGVKWDDATENPNVFYKYLVEYGEPNERLPRPTLNTTSSTTIGSKIEAEETNSIDISNGLENALVTSSRDFIIGFKVEGVSKSPIKYTYTLNGKEVTNSDSTLNFYDRYTTQEVQEILRSMTVESDSDIELKVTLGNLKNTTVYNEAEGHYYSLLKHTSKTSLTGFKSEVAKASNYLGVKPYLANVMDNETVRVIKPLLENEEYTWAKYVGNRKKSNTTQTVDNMVGEFNETPKENLDVTYNYNADGNSLVIYHTNDVAKSVGFQDLPDSLSYSDVGLIEYGNPNERLPRPTVNTTSSTTIGATIEKEEVNSIDISNGLENAIVTSSRDFILGFKIEGVSDNPIKYSYILNGKEVVKTDRVIDFYGKYTPEQVQAILRSLKVESSSNVQLKVTLGNLKPTMVWVEEEGHYYERISEGRLSWTDSKVKAEEKEFMGGKGYLATVTDANINKEVTKLVKTGTIMWFGLYDKTNTTKWEWVTGETSPYRNWSTGTNADNNVHNYAHFRADEGFAGTWNRNTNVISNTSYDLAYLVEYGQPNERLKRPTVNTTSELTIDGVTEEEEVNSVDISKGFKNATVTSSRGYIWGYTIDIESDGATETTYTLKGVKKTSKDKHIVISGIYTTEQVQETLRSMHIKAPTGSKVTVKLGNTILTYNEDNGHYYVLPQTLSNINIGGLDAFNKAKETRLVDVHTDGILSELHNNRGYLATIRTDKEREIATELVAKQNTGAWLGLRKEDNKWLTKAGAIQDVEVNLSDIGIEADDGTFMVMQKGGNLLQVNRNERKTGLLLEFEADGGGRLPRPTVGATSTLKIGDEVKPTIEGAKDIIVAEGNFNLLEGVTANDNVDGDITDTLEVRLKGTETSIKEYNFTKDGSYTFEYSVTDSSGNTTIVDRTITVEMKEINRVDISKGFENAIVESNKQSIQGFKVEVLGDVGKTDVVFKYTVKGKERTSNSRLLNFYDTYTVDELQEALRTFKVVSGEDTEIQVTLGNQKEGVVYVAENGHYYTLDKVARNTWEEHKKVAESTELMGVRGSLGSLKTDTIYREVFDSLKLDSYSWVALGGIWNTDTNRMEWLDGEPLEDMSRFNTGDRYPSASRPYLCQYADGKWYGYPLIGSSCRVTLIEYGQLDERLPKPTVNTSSILQLKGVDEEKEINSVDLTEGLKGAKVNSTRDYILGFKVEGVTKGDLEYTYTLKNGETVTSTDKILNFYGKYTPKEVEDILQSIYIDSLEDVEVRVTLGNLKDEVSYNGVNGHYYYLADKSNAMSWIEAKGRVDEINANNSINGYMVTITSESEERFIESMQKGCNIPLYAEKVDTYSAPNWLTGEVTDYHNFHPDAGNPAWSDPSQTRVLKDYKNGSKWGDIDGNTSKVCSLIIEYGEPTERLPRPTENATDSTIVKAGDQLKLGEPVIANGKVTFPNAKGNIKDRANLQINIFEGYEGNEINYTLNKTKRSHIVPEVVVKGIDRPQMLEILSTLSFKIDYGQNLNIQVVLTDNNDNVLYEGVTSTDATSMSAIDGDLNTSWVEETTEGVATYLFDTPKELDSIEAIHESVVDSKGNTYTVEGLVNGEWVEIGTQTIDYIDLLEQQMVVRIDITNGSYEGIRVRVNNTDVNVNVYDIKFNGEPKKNVTSKDIKGVGMDKDTEAPIITVSHSDMELEKGSSIPKITASAKDNDYLEPNLTSKIVTTILNPSGDIVDSIDNMVVGEWIIRFEVEDRNGNKSKEEVKVTILEDMTAPILTGIRGGVIKQGEAYSLTSQVVATDNVDGVITDNIVITYIDPNGEEQSTIDDSVKGDWRVKYAIDDSVGNHTEKEVTVTVETDATIDLGEPLVDKTNKTIKFPNNIVDLQNNDTKQFRMRFTKGANSVVKYTVGGTEYTHTGDFTADAYNEAELKELLDTLTIEYKGTVEFETGVVNEAYMPLGAKMPNQALSDRDGATTVGGAGTINLENPVYIDGVFFANDGVLSLSLNLKYGSVINKHISTDNNVSMIGIDGGLAHYEGNLVSKIEYNSGYVPLKELLIANFGTEGNRNKVFLDLTPPTLTTNYSDMEVWQGIPVPNIVGSATDDIDGNLNAKVVRTITSPSGDIVDNIDETVVGEWVVHFEVSDKAGNATTKEVRVTVKEDTEAPIITTNYETLEVEKGKTVPTITANATDNSGQLGGAIVKTIIDPDGETQKAISNLVEGVWIVRYEVSDKIGNKTTKDVLVTITPDITPPTIGISPNKDITIEQGRQLQTISASATDIVDGNLTSEIVTTIVNPSGEVVDSIDTMILGEWVVKFEVEDRVGNKSESQRIVNVIKNVNSPTIQGAYNRVVENGVPYDLNNIFIITDDNGLKDTKITVTNPSGEVVDSIDTTIEGDWLVNVIATDKSDNETNRTITVKVLGEASLDLGEHSKNGNVLTFPNAQIDIAEGMSKGLRFNFKENPSAKVSYTLNGKAYSHSGANFVTNGVTKATQEEFIKSLKITSNSTVRFEVGLEGEKWTPTGVVSGTSSEVYKDIDGYRLKHSDSASGRTFTGTVRYSDTVSAEAGNFREYSVIENIKLDYYKDGVKVKSVNIEGSNSVGTLQWFGESIEFDRIDYSYYLRPYSDGRAYIGGMKVGNKYIDGTVREYREDMSAPLIKGARGGTIKQGNPFDLLKNVTVEDVEDGNITKNLELVCIAPDGKEYSNIDDSILGEWTLKYSAKDTANNSVEQTHKVVVESSDTIQLGEEYITDDGYISFRNNTVTIKKGVTQKLRFYFHNAKNSELRYTIGGTEKVIPITEKKDIVLPSYNEEEMREVLDTLKIKYTGHINFTTGVVNNAYTPIGTTSNKSNLVDNIDSTQSNIDGGVQINLVGETVIDRLDLCANMRDITIEAYNKDELVATINSYNGVTPSFGKVIKADKLIISGSGTTGEIKISNFGTENTYNVKDIKASLNLTTEKDVTNTVSGVFGGDGEYTKYELEKKDNLTDKYGVVKTISGGNFTDTLSDTLDPTISVYLQRGKEGTAEVIASSEDKDVDYTYRVKGYNGNVLSGISNESLQTVFASGTDGYVYEVNTEANTELSNTINSKDGKLSLEGLTEESYLHIKAMDKEGNSSKTLHIRLLDANYNNKPSIKTDLNKVIGSGDSFNPMDGVSAYDFEDGDLTDKITIKGLDKLNLNKVGAYKLVYTVEDSKGLKATETVTIHVTGTMDLGVEDGIDEIDINWSSVPNIKKFKVYRSKADTTDYELYTELSPTTTTYTDSYAIDTKAPVIEDIYEVDNSSTDKEIKLRLNNPLEVQNKELVLKDRDLATTYRYYIQGVNESGEIVNSTSVRSGQSKVGIKGYAYSIDDNRETEAPTRLNALNVKTIEEAMVGKEGQILHLRAIDNNGNLGGTVHYLIGSKYITNHKPVIYGIKPQKIEMGDTKFDIMDSISARDTEDGDLTDVIEVITDLDINKEGKYDVTYKVVDSDGNERVVSTTVTVVRYNTLKPKGNKDSNRVELDWSDIAPTDKEVYYEVRKKNASKEFVKIATTEETSYVDTMSADIMGAIYKGNKKTENEDGTLTVDIKATDVGYRGEYQVVTRLKEDNTTIGTMTDLKSGKEYSVVGEQIGGIKGYSWHLSDVRLDTVDEIIDQESNVITFEPRDYEWLHVAPVDIYGNMGDTIHIQLKASGLEGTDTLPTLIAEDRVVEIGSDFNPMKGVQANDVEDGDITDRVEVIGEVNTYAEGDYPLIYKVVDNDGNVVTTEIVVTVIRSATKPPTEEEFEENKKHKIVVNDLANPDYVELGASSYDPLRRLEVTSTKDGNIKNKVKYTSNIDLNNLGSYIVNYKVRDSIGNEMYFSRVVEVVKEGEVPKPPTGGGGSLERPNVPEFSNYSDIQCKVGDKINIMQGVTAKDEEDGDLTSKIKITGTVNTLKPGYYRVQFKVTDSDGYTTYASRGVNVQEVNGNNGGGTLPPTEGGDGNDNGNNGGGTPLPPVEPEQPEPPKPPTEGGSGEGNEGGNGNGGDIEETLPPTEGEDENTKPPTEPEEPKPPTEEEGGDTKPPTEEEGGDIKPPTEPPTEEGGNTKPPTEEEGGDTKPPKEEGDDTKPTIKPPTVEEEGSKPPIDVDTDGDGKPDINIDTNGDGKPDINIDTNGDGKPDINIDTNGDGKPDINIDTNGDGKPNINIDTTGDGKPNVNIDTNGDGKPNINIDTNGDGKADTNIDESYLPKTNDVTVMSGLQLAIAGLFSAKLIGRLRRKKDK